MEPTKIPIIQFLRTAFMFCEASLWQSSIPFQLGDIEQPIIDINKLLGTP